MSKRLNCGWYLCVFTLMMSACISTARAQEVTSKNFFGLIIHKADSGSPWPPFRFGMWRLWDAHVTWPHLEPQRGRWNFERLDRFVAMAERQGVEPSLVLAHSPKWASARPTEPSGYGVGLAAEPSDIEDWKRYIRTVVERYRGRIRYFEVWNEPSDKTHFSGSMEKYIELVRTAADIAHQVNPDAKIIAPSVNGGGRHLKFLDDFLGLGGKKYIDVIGHHFYVFRAGPEAIQPIIRGVKDVMRRHGIQNMPLWNTEIGWWIADSDGTPDPAMVANGWRKLDSSKEAGATLLKSLVISRGEGIEKVVWYSWDNIYGLGMLESTSHAPKPIVAAYGHAVEWLEGKKIKPCSASSVGVWTCNLEDAHGTGEIIAWNASPGGTRWVPPTGTAWQYRNFGSALTHAVVAGGVWLDEHPVLLRTH